VHSEIAPGDSPFFSLLINDGHAPGVMWLPILPCGDCTFHLEMRRFLFWARDGELLARNAGGGKATVWRGCIASAARGQPPARRRR